MTIPHFIIFTGPMFGSKTTRLIAALDRYKYQKRKIIAFKPKIDDRYVQDKISTHSGASIPARIVKNGMEIHQYVSHHDEYDIIAVDEAFMLQGISWVLIDLFKRGKTIVISSLDLSATGKPFEEMQAMMPWATHIEKCPSVCTICGTDAYYTHKKVEDLEEITIGGAELYEPRCWNHHNVFLKQQNSFVDHIALRVSDLKVAEEWYTKQLDGKVTFRDQNYIRMRLSNTNIALIDEKHYPYPHFAILVEKKENLAQFEGIRIEHRDGTTGVYVKDPFGNYLEYIWYSDEQKRGILSD